MGCQFCFIVVAMYNLIGARGVAQKYLMEATQAKKLAFAFGILFGVVLIFEIGVTLSDSLMSHLVFVFIYDNAIEPWFASWSFLIVTSYPFVYFSSISLAKILYASKRPKLAVLMSLLPSVNIILVVYGFLGH